MGIHCILMSGTELSILSQELVVPSRTGDIFAMGGNMSRRLQQFTFEQAHPGEIVNIAPLAGTHPPETFDWYSRYLHDKQIDSIGLFREDCRDEEQAIEKIRKAKHLFLTAGNQLFIFETINGTTILEEIKDRYTKSGLNIWAESAGIAALGDLSVYSYGGLIDDDPIIDARAQKAAIHTFPKVGNEIRTNLLHEGLGILPRTIIDSHFAREVRIKRLAESIRVFPEMLGVGIDEDTTCVIHNRESCTIHGYGRVYLLASSQRLEEEGIPIETNKPLHLVVLKEGDEFNLRNLELNARDPKRTWSNPKFN